MLNFPKEIMIEDLMIEDLTIEDRMIDHSQETEKAASIDQSRSQEL